MAAVRIILLMMIVLLASCSAQKRAQYHLRRAVKLDPSVVSTYTTDTIIKLDTLISDTDTVYIGPYSSTDTARADSVLNQLRSGEEVVIVEDKKVRASVRLKHDKIISNVRVKPDTIVLTEEIPVIIEKKVTVPGKQVEIEKKVRGFWYWSGIVAWAALLLSVGLYFIRKSLNPF